MKFKTTFMGARSFAQTLALGLVAASLAPASASAHTVLEYQVATAGKSYKATFKVGHGCGTSPTRQIVVDLPAGVQGAKPMPKPGWKIDVMQEKLAHPYTSHGRIITEDVSRITWTAKTPEDFLPNGFYDEFVLVGTLPEQTGLMYWPVQQICELGHMDWVEVPKAGQKLSDLKYPAAVLELLSGDSADAAHQN